MPTYKEYDDDKENEGQYNFNPKSERKSRIKQNNEY